MRKYRITITQHWICHVFYSLSVKMLYNVDFTHLWFMFLILLIKLCGVFFLHPRDALLRDYRKAAVNHALKKQERVICAFYVYRPHVYSGVKIRQIPHI